MDNTVDFSDECHGYKIFMASEEDRDEIMSLYKAQIGREYCPWSEEYPSNETIDLTTDCIASEGDTRLLRASNGPLELYLGGKTINRNLKEGKNEGTCQQQLRLGRL